MSNLSIKSRTEELGWRNTVQIVQSYKMKNSNIILLLTRYRSMWDGHLDIMAKVQHKIEVEEGVLLFTSVQYRAGIRRHKIKKVKVQKIRD